PQDFSSYYDPSDFIAAHRHLQTSGASTRVAMNTFTYDSRIQWDRLRNFSHAHSGGGTSESAYALKKALAAQREELTCNAPAPQARPGRNTSTITTSNPPPG